MGFSNGKNESKEEKERRVKNALNITMSEVKELTEKSESSVCEIKIDDGYGTGFICTLKYPDKDTKMFCLITDNHIINQDMLDNKEYLEIKLNKETKKINLNKKRRKWTDIEKDYTCIEILEDDNLFQNRKLFDINDYCYNIDYNKNNYDNKGIIIVAIGKTKEIEFAPGVLFAEESKNSQYLFFHNCSTESGFSGGPIILKNDLSIIGIHRGYDKEKEMNLGLYFSEILNDMKKSNIEKNIINANNSNDSLSYESIQEKKGEKKNEIIFKIYIENKDEDVLILKSNNKNIKDIMWNINVYLNKKEVDIIESVDNAWRINSKYFKQNGEYEIKIEFKKVLTNITDLFEDNKIVYYIDLSNFDTSKVTNMAYMFHNCHKLKVIKGLNKFKTNEVTSMNSMFYCCKELEELDLTNFDTSKVANMDDMFLGCNKSLKKQFRTKNEKILNKKEDNEDDNGKEDCDEI